MTGSINAVTAAAGAGKTTRIVADIASEVALRSPEEILATTFTIKSADELIQRARAELFRRGDPETAARLLGARFGTVNAVCGQILSEFAIDLGRSPTTSVIGEANESLAFSVAADMAISAHALSLNALADRFGYNEPRHPSQGEPPDWRKTVRKIVGLARSNGLRPSDLAGSADRSVESLLTLYPAAASDGSVLDAELAAAVDAALAARPATLSAKGAKSAPVLKTAQQRLVRGEPLGWPVWARLTAVECAPTKDGQAYLQALQRVVAAAGGHARHPRLRADLERFVRETFACAAEALEAYQDWKAARGFVDFVDQEALALQILQVPAMAQRLRERVSRVFVDEFQDSSPLQLAVFAALADLVEQSTWVGDPKQAIYGFRNADTDLTQSAFVGAQAAGAASDVLATSWRSRPSIVRFANAVFTPAFERMGLPAAQHQFSGAARSDDGFETPALAWWRLTGKVDEQAAAFAVELARVLSADDRPRVADRDGGLRPIGAGDVAVLCRTNGEVARFADAIGRAGLAVSVERQGLARTPHVELVLAACRWVADSSDRLALAELARFFAEQPDSEAWLVAASADGSDAALRATAPVAQELEGLRDRQLNLTPAELVDAVLAIPALMSRIERWGDHADRLYDLEALRGSAGAYESECAASGAPATLSGFLMAVADSDPLRPPTLSAGAVQVMTYHGAKGLEWPMTVLTGLGWTPRARLFEPVAESDGALDWRAPLAGRWIRFWPSPYGTVLAKTDLDVAAQASRFGQNARRRAVEEDTRLLYVGVTRARDYLVVAPPPGELNWLRALDGEDGPHVLTPSDTDGGLTVGGQTFVADIRTLAAGEVRVAAAEATFVRAGSIAVGLRAPLYLRPSSATGDGWRVSERVALGGRLPLDGVADMRALGEALHALLASDDPHRGRDVRLTDAADLLRRWDVQGFAAEHALAASDRLHAYVSQRWSGAVLRHEAPVTAFVGDQVVQGRIDLLIDGAEGAAVIDHKSFPGRFEAWEPQALGYAPQLGLYADAVAAVSGLQCKDMFVHMPIVGQLIGLSRV